MLNKKKVVIAIAILLVLILLIIIKATHNKVIDIGYKSNVSISEIKNEKGIVGEDELYEINEEYDGRKMLAIKDEYIYKVALIGIYQKIANIEFPDESISCVENINKYYDIAKESIIYTKGGLIIPEKDQEKVLSMLKTNSNYEYYFDDNNYLKIDNYDENNLSNFDQGIIEKIKSKTDTIIMTYESEYYSIDNVSGNIINYPFCDLDPSIDFESIKYDNYSIRFINPETQDITFLVN